MKTFFWCVLLIKKILQHNNRPTITAFYGINWFAKRLCDFLKIKIAVAAQGQYHAIFWREFGHCRFEYLSGFFPFKNFLQRLCRIGKRIGNYIPAVFGVKIGKWNYFLLLKKIYCRIFGNRKNPSFETFALIKFFKMFPNLNKNFLRNVFGILCISDIPICKAINWFEISPNKKFQRRFITLKIVCYKLLIRLIHRLDYTSKIVKSKGWAPQSFDLAYDGCGAGNRTPISWFRAMRATITPPRNLSL